MASDQLFDEVQHLALKRPGPKNTDVVLNAVDRRARELSISTIVVATCSGRVGLRALELLGGDRNIVCVSHVTGFREPNHQEMEEKVREDLIKKGARVFTGQHAFGGVGRGVRNKLGTFQVDEIIAWTLRMLGQGTKVCVEVVLMTTDAGLVRTDEDVIAVGGTATGADTACVIRPANSANVYDLKIREIICKPF